MKKQARKIVVITGPTASGKSDLAKKLIKKYNGIAISADSRQIYRHMDIGTGKDNSFFQHMIDIVEPNEDYSAAKFQEQVYKIIEEIFALGKLPIIVGGTGLYINAIIYGYEFPKANMELRSEIESWDVSKIERELKKIDPISYEKNKDNPRRMVRALESYMSNLKPLSDYKKRKPKFDYLLLGVDLPRKELYERIDARVDKRIAEGMVEEVENLLKMGITHERLFRFGLEYRFISEYLQRKMTKDEMIQKLKYRIHDFARRQLTWERKNKEILWVKNSEETLKLVDIFLK